MDRTFYFNDSEHNDELRVMTVAENEEDLFEVTITRHTGATSSTPVKEVAGPFVLSFAEMTHIATIADDLVEYYNKV